MDLFFGSAGERAGRGPRGRGRGSRVIAYPGPHNYEAASRAEYQENLTRKQMNNNQLALARLVKELTLFPEVSTARAYDYKRLLGQMEQVQTMNMKTLAGAIVMYQQSDGKLSPELFTDTNLAPIFDRLKPAKYNEKTKDDQAAIYQGYKFSLLRYYRALRQYLQRQNTHQ